MEETLGSRLRHLCELAGLTGRELDRLAGKKAEGLANMIMKGERSNTQIDTIERYARVLGARVGWLAAGEGSPPSKRDVVDGVEAARAAKPRRSVPPPAKSAPRALGRAKKAG